MKPGGVIERNALSNVCNYEKMCSVWNGGRFFLVSFFNERERERERERENTQNVYVKKTIAILKGEMHVVFVWVIQQYMGPYV